MKRSDQPTEYIFIRAYTNSEYDYCDFAIIRITAQWIADMRKRLNLLEPFNNDDSFCSHVYWDYTEGYYTNIVDEETEADITDLILKDGEEWAFVTLGENELDTFPVPESRLGTHQLVLYKDSSSRFTADGRDTGEEFYTAEFNVEEFISAGIPATI